MSASTPAVSRRASGVTERAVDLWSASEDLRLAARSRLAFVTSYGWAVAVCGIVSWLFATRLGWEELDLFAAACLVILGLAALFTLGRAELAIDVRVEPPRVVVGERAVGGVAIRNVSKRRLVPVPVELPVGADHARFDLPPLASGATFEEAFIVPTTRRAVIPVGPARSVRSDPLGLLRREVEFSETIELFVHPRTVLLDPFGTGLLRDLEGNTTDAISPSDLAFHSLRGYVPGDDRRHVHWRTTARLPSGELMVRQFLDTRRSHVVVALDCDRSSYTDEAEFELAVSAAASFALCGVRTGQEVTVVPGQATVARGPGTTVLDAFSRVELVERSFGLARLGVFVADSCGDASLVVFATGSELPTRDLRTATSKLDADAAAVSIVAATNGRSTLHLGSGLRAVRLGALSDLPGLASAVARA